MGYDNTQRSAAARATRARVLTAAYALFVGRGFGRTTIRQVAEAADVSPETIYKAFGGKAGLLKAVYDVTLAGDDDDVPISQRPEAMAARRATTPEGAAAAYSELALVLSSRTGPLLRVLLGARDTDPSLAEFAATIERERLGGSMGFVGHWHSLGWLRDDLTVERAADIVWALNAPQPHWLLEDRGWSARERTEWFADVLRHAVFA